ncbi:MAG: Ig-like domain-containing protein [Magnetococcus sp. WYHC-3]
MMDTLISRNKSNTWRRHLLPLLAVMVLSGCGGTTPEDAGSVWNSGSGNTTIGNNTTGNNTTVSASYTVNQTLTGILSASVISNVTWSTPTLNGVTGSNGSFQYVATMNNGTLLAGEQVTFSLGKVVLGQWDPDAVSGFNNTTTYQIFPSDIVGSDEAQQKNYLALLMSFEDSAGRNDTSSIVINTSASQVLSNLTQTFYLNDGSIPRDLDNFTRWMNTTLGVSNTTLANSSQVLTHYEQTRVSQSHAPSATRIEALTLTQGATSLVADGNSTVLVRARATGTVGSNASAGLQGVTVTFSSTAGSFPATTAITDANGTAQQLLTAPTNLGNATITVSAGGFSRSGNITFVAGAPASIVLSSTTSATTAPGGQQSLSARVSDAHGNPVQGETLSLTLNPNNSGGSLNRITGTTGDQGTLNFVYTAGSADNRTDTINAQVTSGAISASLPINVSATGGVSTPIEDMDMSLGGTQLVANGNDSVLVRTTVTGANDTALSGLVVVYTTTAGRFLDSGTTTTNATTDSEGQAEVRLVSPTNVGRATLTAQSGGFVTSTNVDFIAGSPARVSLLSLNGTSVDVGNITNLRATVYDLFNNVVSNESVTLAYMDPYTTHGDLGSSTITTASNGRATTTYTGRSSGNDALYGYTANWNGTHGENVTGRSGNLTLTVSGARNPHNLSLLTSSPQVGSDGSSEVTLTAIVRDESSNLINGTEVQFRVASNSTGTLRVTQNVTNTTGTATARLTAAPSKENRDILVSAFVANNASIVGNQSIAVTGTTLSASGSQSIISGRNATLTLTLQDSVGTGISGENITIRSANNNTLAAVNATGAASNITTQPTSLVGQALVVLTGVTTGNDTLSVSAYNGTLNTTYNITVSDNVTFLLAANKTDIAVVNNTTEPFNTTGGYHLTFTWIENGWPIPNQTVAFTTSRGQLSTDGVNTTTIATTNANGTIGLYLRGTSPGEAIITARATYDEDLDDDSVRDSDPFNEDLDNDTHFDIGEDANGNGVLDSGEDRDGDGLLDANEDLNGNLTLESSEDLDNDTRFDVGEDCNRNGVLDTSGVDETSLGRDCNGDGDSLDNSTSEDVDGDGVLDNNEDLDGNRKWFADEDFNHNNIWPENKTLSAQANTTLVAVNPARIIVQANPTTLQSNSPGDETHKSEILATVRDRNGNLVKSQTVVFSIDSDTTNGRLSTDTATTDNYGQARTYYIAGTTSSASRGVVIRGTMLNATHVEIGNSTTALTVAGEAVFVSLGTGNVLSEVNNTLYSLPYSVLVTDANGSPVANATVNLGVTSTYFSRGQYCQTFRYTDVTNGTVEYYWSWNQSSEGWVATEDDNANGILDYDPDFDGNTSDSEDTFPPEASSEDTNGNSVLDSGEDRNNNGVIDNISGNGSLDPGQVSTPSVSSVVTDSSGFGSFSLLYPQNYGAWVKVKLTASTQVSGTESSRSEVITLPVLSSDYSDIDVSGPGRYSPYGNGTSVCNSTSP